MKSVPRILPLVGVAICGVLAVNALAGAKDMEGLLSGARAFAEEAATPAKAEKGKGAKADAKSESADPAAPTGAAADALSALPAPTITPKPVCAPTAAELAKQAGLSPAELQVLQSLGARRGQLDQRESDLNTQLALMAAAEAKLDAKLKALNGLKGEIQGLLVQTDAKQAAEIDRLVKVFEGMKAKDAAPRLASLDDNVRIPIAAKMKERSLSAIVAQMPPAQAKDLTEKLARRFSDARAAADKAAAAEAAATSAKASVDPTAPAAAPKKVAAKKPVPRKRAPASQQAAAKTPAAAPAAAAPATPAAPQPYAPPAAAAPAKTG